MARSRARYPAIQLTDELVIGEAKNAPPKIFDTLTRMVGSDRDVVILRHGNAEPIVTMPFRFWLRTLRTIEVAGGCE